MAIPQIEIGENLVINLNRLGEETDFPARDVCDALYAAIKPRIKDENEFGQKYWGVKEVIKDVVTHSDEAYPRLILICHDLGETTLRTVNRKKQESDYSEEEIETGLACNGYGEEILNEYCEGNYSRVTDGDVVMGYLRIPHDGTDRRLLN